MSLVEYLGRVTAGELVLAKALEGAPKRWILGKGLSIHLSGLFSLHLALVDLAEEEETRSTVRHLAQNILLGVMLLQGPRLSAV
jgi:hypothetical protein